MSFEGHEEKKHSLQEHTVDLTVGTGTWHKQNTQDGMTNLWDGLHFPLVAVGASELQSTDLDSRDITL